MKNLKVSEDLCIGCGACMAIDPEHFSFSDDGLSEVKSQENLDSTTLVDAIESCPTAAIAVEGNQDEYCGGTCECEECDCEK